MSSGTIHHGLSWWDSYCGLQEIFRLVCISFMAHYQTSAFSTFQSWHITFWLKNLRHSTFIPTFTLYEMSLSFSSDIHFKTIVFEYSYPIEIVLNYFYYPVSHLVLRSIKPYNECYTLLLYFSDLWTFFLGPLVFVSVNYSLLIVFDFGFSFQQYHHFQLGHLFNES